MIFPESFKSQPTLYWWKDEELGDADEGLAEGSSEFAEYPGGAGGGGRAGRL
jgi:hypothetical protein